MYGYEGKNRITVGSAPAEVHEACERIRFRMRTTERIMPTFAHDLAVLNDHAADHWVRLDRTLAARGERERVRHVADVVVVAACHDGVG